MRIAAGLRAHHVADEVGVRVTPLRREAVGAEHRRASVGGEVTLHVLLGGVHADRLQRDGQRRGLAVERHLHALGADREPEHRRVGRDRGRRQGNRAHPEGDDRRGPPPRMDHGVTLRGGRISDGREPDTTYTGRGLGRWLRG